MYQWVQVVSQVVILVVTGVVTPQNLSLNYWELLIFDSMKTLYPQLVIMKNTAQHPPSTAQDEIHQHLLESFGNCSFS